VGCREIWKNDSPKKCSCTFWQMQSLAKYCVIRLRRTGCPNTHILKTVCSVLSSHLFLVFGSNLAFDPKNKKQMHFSGSLIFATFFFSFLFLTGSNITAEEGKTMQIKSTAFEENGVIPKKYTCDGSDVSPPLSWTKPPSGTKSIALICDDPDAPVGTWVHWVLYGLSPENTALPENVPVQKDSFMGVAKQGINDFHRIGYGGPCPPKGPAHRYFFKIYALDIELNLPAGATKKEVEKVMKGHILAEGQMAGKYGR